MPYKLSENGKTVLIKRAGHWVTLKHHKSKGKAQAHLAALKINVEHKGK